MEEPKCKKKKKVTKVYDASNGFATPVIAYTMVVPIPIYAYLCIRFDTK